MHYLTACTIAKDEARNLPEWFAYLRMQGFEHVFLYDNNSTDDTALVCDQHRFFVTRIPFAQHPCQIAAYTHYLRDYGHLSEWTAFIDVDEYPISKKLEQQFSEILGSVPVDAAGLALNWKCFGTGGHVRRPNGLAIESYLWRPQRDFRDVGGLVVNSHVKLIVRPRRIARVVGPHHAQTSAGVILNTAGEVMSTPWSDAVHWDVAYYCHFFTRSLEEWQEKVCKGRPDVEFRRNYREYLPFDARDEVDASAAAWAKSVKEAML
jgi:hypothetical protein